MSIAQWFKRSWLVAAVVLICSTGVTRADDAAGPRYVFLFIGDGMGTAQVQLADRFAESGDGLVMTSLPVKGLIQTRSADAVVTDSAAAATALAAGVKTNNGMIGQLPDGTAVPSIAQQLTAAGWKTGVISSVQANHATPASFYAHTESRNMYNEISAQFPASGIHFLAGRSLNSQDRSQEQILSQWRSDGIEVASTFDQATAAPRDTRLAFLSSSLADVEDKPGDLADAVKLAIQRLDNEQGFFITVEGGAIDWAGHGNHALNNIRETLAFDRAIAVAVAFHEQRPDQTLIVITADHETGGLGVDFDRLDREAIGAMSDRQSQLAKAIGEDADAITPQSVLTAASQVLGGDPLSESEQAELTKAAAGETKRRRQDILNRFQKLQQARAGITWSTGGHTAADVPVFAIGNGSEQFSGTNDNTQIPLRILELSSPQTPANHVVVPDQIQPMQD